MFSNMFGKFRWLISSIAVFVTIWAVLASIITIMWWLMPIVPESFMLNARWGISAAIICWLLGTRRLTIN